MVIISKNYIPDQDLNRVLDFLRQTYLETKVMFNYFPNQFENIKSTYVNGIHLWEEVIDKKTKKIKKIVGLTSPERKYLYYVNIHPDYQYLLPEMIEWIINHSKNNKDDLEKPFTLIIICLNGYTALERILKSYGFEKDSDYGFFRIRDLNKPVHNYIIPEGFKIRSIKGKSEYGDYARAIREVFGHGEWFNAGVVEELDSNSYYNQDLDLIVEAPNGDIASFCTFRMDPITRITELEPMGTVPKYRKLGLGLAILGEGFKKLEKYDPSLLYIGGAANNPGANKLYEATDFIVKGIFYKWIKNI